MAIRHLGRLILTGAALGLGWQLGRAAWRWGWRLVIAVGLYILLCAGAG